MSPPPPKFRRLQSATEREAFSEAARREREAVPVEPVEEEDSRAYDVAERPVIRSRRETGKRLEKLETFKDEAIESFSEFRVSIADIRGDQKAAAASLRAIEKHLDERQHKERITFAATVDVETAEKKDTIDARKGKRDLYLKILGGVLTGGVLGKLLHMAGIL
jgi:hypothetical protein